MKVSTRIFFCYLIISSVCLYFPFDWILDTMRTRYLEGVEDPLVDQANMLASVVEQQLEGGYFKSDDWSTIFEGVYKRDVGARIYRLQKHSVDSLLYITDAKGRVTFHSRDRAEIGKDYSQWRDVHLSLDGKYGARTTREVSDDERSTVLWVAAPLRLNGEIVGVLSVGKPTTNISWFVDNAKLQIAVIAFLALLTSCLLGFLASRWITGPIYRLTRYARGVRDGHKPDFPKLGRSEIGEMGKAFEEMREALEGKRYVEQYVQNLTHEIKSPLSAIRGASELLTEPMEEERREKFLGNIQREARRMQTIVDRMLELSSLENRKSPQKVEPVSVHALVRTVVENIVPSLAGRHIQVEELQENRQQTISGDQFLLYQALDNLLQNAVDFSPENGTIILRVTASAEDVAFAVIDRGSGFPDFAEGRLFEKFFSLQRPGKATKSTGLGLNFVKQVALLHHGTIHLENREEGGVTATLRIPIGNNR